MSAHPRRRGELLEVPEQDGWAVYEASTDSVVVLNDSARAIWELCDGETTAEEMAVAVAQLTGLDPERATQEVTTALDALTEAKLLDYQETG